MATAITVSWMGGQEAERTLRVNLVSVQQRQGPGLAAKATFWPNSEVFL